VKRNSAVKTPEARKPSREKSNFRFVKPLSSFLAK
jgi:hypothetical protein